MRQSLKIAAMRYLAVLTTTVIICLIAAFTFNALVDPLWYFSGNRLGPVNFAFNERLSKVNLIAGYESEYDCVIFGDSRVTLLPSTAIKGHKCFNFAFSAGEINEFVPYASWLKERGLDPKLVIVGVSAGNFRKRSPSYNIPDFINEDRNPTPAVIKYLSLDVIAMSWRTLFGTSPIDREYDHNFQCLVAVTTQYNPRKPIRDLHSGPFDAREPLEQYKALRAVYPDAKFVGYAPPISAWAIADYSKIKWLESYTKSLSDAATVFDRFVDASIPSPVTIDPANTYDGTHYSSDVNKEIAAKLFEDDVNPGLDLKKISWDEMLKLYRQRLNTYSAEIAAGEAAPSDGMSPATDLPAQ